MAADDAYTTAAATVDFAAGETTKTVEVTVTGDTTKKANETLNLVLSAPTGAVTSDTSGTANHRR